MTAICYDTELLGQPTPAMITKRQRSIVAGQTHTDVWCVPCNAAVAVRVALHIGDLARPPAAQLTVCASCGTRFIPAVPQVTITATAKSRRRPRPWLAFTWWRYRRECRRRTLSPTGCAVTDCPRPGWHDCAWYQAVDGGRIRWVFCGRKHRRKWLEHDSGMQ